VTVLDEFRDGLMYAERHALDVTRRDGTTERAEIYIIGRYAPDGRFQYIHEAGFRSRPAKPAELEGAEMTRLNDPDPAGIPEDVREFLAGFPPDPMVKMLTHSVATVKPFILLARTQFTSLDLSARAREPAILTVAVSADCEFEFAQHVPISEAAGSTSAPGGRSGTGTSTSSRRATGRSCASRPRYGPLPSIPDATLGVPRPGEGQNGSPGFVHFHNAKSRGSRFPRSFSSAMRMCCARCRESEP
jgi:hypothetical protein